MGAFLMEQFKTLKFKLPVELSNHIIKALEENPFNPDISILTGYGVLTELQLNGNGKIADMLLEFSMEETKKLRGR